MEATMLQELSQGEHQVFACNSDTVLEESKFQTMDTTGATIWLDTPVADLVERMESKEMIIEGGGDPGNILQEMLDDRKKYYQRANVRVATDNLTPEVTAKEILKVLKSL
jgi:shikimate kinase